MLGRSLLALLVLVLLHEPAGAASTSDLEREKNWSDQIVDSLIAGEAVWLEAQQVKFLGLYTAPTGTPKSSQAVILLHGRGVHPAWGFIDTLRIDLADAGWHTLSLQMPILEGDVKYSEYERTFPEAYARIDAGIRYLQQRGVKNVFLMGHSLGAVTAVAYLAERPAPWVAGIVAIGLSTESAGGPRMHPVEQLKAIRKPIYDIYGSDDLITVREPADARRAAAEAAGNRYYRQEKVQGANHFFTDHYEPLKSRVIDALKKMPVS